MKRVVFVFSFIALTALAAGGISALTLAPSLGDYSFVGCDGGAAQTVTAGNYLVRIAAADSTVCSASTCTSGGQTWPQGTIIYLAYPTGSVSCRNGSLFLTQAK